jgi:hypothetical protein
MKESCGVCKDSKGFYIRECIGCGNQKLLDKEHAAILNLPEGIFVKRLMRKHIFKDDIVAMNELFYKIRWVKLAIELQRKEEVT